MKITAVFFIFFTLFQLSWAQPDDESLTLGKGTLLEGDSTYMVLVNYGILYSSSKLDYDTILWVEEKNQTTSFVYPQLSEGKEHVIQFKVVDEKNPEHFYEVFLHLRDSLRENLQLSMDNAVLYAIKGGQLHPHPHVLKELSGIMDLTKTNKEDYTISLTFNSTHQINTNIQTLKFSGNFLLPSSKYRESDLTSPISRKAGKKSYRRNLQLAGIMVMVFLAVFIFD